MRFMEIVFRSSANPCNLEKRGLMVVRMTMIIMIFSIFGGQSAKGKISTLQ